MAGGDTCPTRVVAGSPDPATSPDQPGLWQGLLTLPPAPTVGLLFVSGDLRSATVARSGDLATTGGRPQWQGQETLPQRGSPRSPRRPTVGHSGKVRRPCHNGGQPGQSHRRNTDDLPHPATQ